MTPKLFLLALAVNALCKTGKKIKLFLNSNVVAL
jgi:hypothetical protein